MKSSSKISKSWFGGLFAAGLGFLSVSAAHAQIILSDGTFTNSNMVLQENAGTTATIGQEPSGGNPGDWYLEYFENYTGPTYAIEAAVIDTTLTYNPSSQGAITSLTLGADFRSSVAYPGIYFFALQNGVLYADLANPLPLSDQTDSWTNFSANPSGASSFTPLTGSTPLNVSATGGAITFGVGVDASFASSSPVVASYDNFTVAVNEAPEPSVFSLLLLGALGLLAFFRFRALRA